MTRRPGLRAADPGRRGTEGLAHRSPRLPALGNGRDHAPRGAGLPRAGPWDVPASPHLLPHPSRGWGPDEGQQQGFTPPSAWVKTGRPQTARRHQEQASNSAAMAAGPARATVLTLLHGPAPCACSVHHLFA